MTTNKQIMDLCNNNLRIVVFGSGGFIGTVMLKTLRSAGFDVWGITRHHNQDSQTIFVDLLDEKKTKTAFQNLGNVNAVIHLAALSNGSTPPIGYTLETVNCTITKNIINAIGTVEHFIYFSSISVYGEDRRNGIIQPTDELRPASLYGIGKKQCEKMILEQDYTTTNIFRPSPVYSETYLRNVSMRAYFPYTKIKIRIIPTPSYSFCHVDNVCNAVLKSILLKKPGKYIGNLVDEIPHSQKEIIKKFSGFAIPLPSFIFLPVYWLFRLIPGAFGYKLRCLYRKLFASCLYSSNIIEVKN
jgi:nucleoside-diphosphate-sugar epimerase